MCGLHPAQVAELQENCTRLREHTAASEAQCASLEVEAGEMDARWRAAAAETARLCAELERMRRMCQVRSSSDRGMYHPLVLFQNCTGSPWAVTARHG